MQFTIWLLKNPLIYVILNKDFYLKGKHMEPLYIVKNPQFEISAVCPKQYPKNDMPEIVLVGKSNVGNVKERTRKGWLFY